MREVDSYYRSGKFPIMEVFAECTETIKSSAMQPVEALVLVTDELHKRNLGRVIDYGSTAITTAGHASIPGLDMAQIIMANTRSARLVCSVLEKKGDIEGRNLALSADMGDTGWSQLQFNAFWQLFIPIMNPREVVGRDMLAYSQFEQKLKGGLEHDEVNTGMIQAANLSREERLPEYIKHAKSYARTIKSMPGTTRPVDRIIRLLGKGITIGGEAESVIGKEFAIPQLCLAAMQPAPTKGIAEDVPILEEDITLLTRYGEQIVFPARKSLTLIRDTSGNL